MKVVIIGGGPAGMLSAISAGTNKNDVTILEKMNNQQHKIKQKNQSSKIKGIC